MILFRNFSAFKYRIRGYCKENLDAEKLFLNAKINNILQKLTDRDPLKVHKSSLRKRENPTIHLLTNEQHKEMESKNIALTNQKLQIPPIKNARTDNIEILEKNDLLNRFVPEGNRFVCVDIGTQSKSHDRLMSVREADGVLRTVSSIERDRFNQVFFPLPGREIIPPPMFNDDNLKVIMEEGRYAYILDRSCIQFEPDDPIHIGTCHRVYDHVDANNAKLHGIRSLATTRHFAGLALYLVMHNNVGNLLVDLISTDRWDAVDHLMDLYRLVHPHSAALEERADSVVERVSGFIEFVPVSPRQRGQVSLLLERQREALKASSQ